MEWDPEEERETVGVVVGVMEMVRTGQTLLKGLLLPLPEPHSVEEPLGLLDTDTLAVIVSVDDRLRVNEEVMQGLLEKEGLAVEDRVAVPPGVEVTQAEGESVTVTVWEGEGVTLTDLEAFEVADTLVVSLGVKVSIAVCDTLGVSVVEMQLVAE